MKLRPGALILLAFVLLPHPSSSQCSDAGVCSIGHRPSGNLSHSVSFSYLFGSSGDPDKLTFHSVEVAAEIGIVKNGRLSLRLPFNSQSGPLGSASGIGDVQILWTQEILDGPDVLLSLQGGIKAPTGSVTKGGLPQAYQSGLGTTDFIVGVRGQADQWAFALAYQLAGGRNKNPVTRLLRGSDLLLRAGYTATIELWTLTLEALAIKRLGESSVLTSSAGQPETFGTIPNSDQAQVNLVARGSRALSEALTLNAFLAIPTLKRDVNVDGLKRSIVLSAGLSVSL